VPETPSRRRRHFGLHFRVRPVLMRWLVCAVSLAITAILVPHVYFMGSDAQQVLLAWLVVSAVFGLLLTFIKPLVQLLLLPLIFVSFGLVVVLINTIIIWLLNWIFPNWFQVDHLLWALVAGLVSGVLVTVFENLFGMTPPIILGQTEALRVRLARAKPAYVEGELLDVAVTGKDKLKRIVGKGDGGDGDATDTAEATDAAAKAADALDADAGGEAS
jgi:putative membrane protein